MFGLTMMELLIFGGAAGFIGMVALMALPRAKGNRRGGADDPTKAANGKKNEDDEFWSSTMEAELGGNPGLKRMLLPKEGKSARKLGEQLIQAGMYKRSSFIYFTLVRLVMMLVFPGIGLLLWWAGFMSLPAGVITGSVLGLLAMIGPSFYLDSVKKKRQSEVKRALPDALDVINICLEGGMSLNGAFNKVTLELKTAYPMLASEFAIIQREVQMGRTTGEALRSCARRFDLEELRSLASVILQSERFGASAVKALKVHAETLRVRRMQYAEELAQKASVKILVPTLLLIFPALFVVILGPAAFDVYKMMQEMAKGG